MNTDRPDTFHANTRLPRGHVLTLRTPAPYDLPFHAYLPHGELATDRVLICVHGIHRRARNQADAFRNLADRLGLALVAPRFDADRYPRFQRLAVGDHGPRADLALDAAVLQVAAAAGLDLNPARLLFGYSGGGQFAHRYAAAHPGRVAAVTVGAAGWYTLPDPTRRFPHGVGARGDFPAIDLAAYLEIPMAVMVGEHDRGRGPGFNCSGSKDRDQGRTRIDRGRHFVASMRRAARDRGLDTSYRFVLLPNVGHDFDDAASSSSLLDQVGAFFIESGSAGAAASGRRMTGSLRPAPQEEPSPEGGPCRRPPLSAQAFG